MKKVFGKPDRQYHWQEVIPHRCQGLRVTISSIDQSTTIWPRSWGTPSRLRNKLVDFLTQEKLNEECNSIDTVSG